MYIIHQIHIVWQCAVVSVYNCMCVCVLQPCGGMIGTCMRFIQQKMHHIQQVGGLSTSQTGNQGAQQGFCTVSECSFHYFYHQQENWEPPKGNLRLSWSPWLPETEWNRRNVDVYHSIHVPIIPPRGVCSCTVIQQKADVFVQHSGPWSDVLLYWCMWCMWCMVYAHPSDIEWQGLNGECRNMPPGEVLWRANIDLSTALSP